jgi:hypothetical protein
MKENLPEVINNAMALFERSFELEPSEDQVRMFKNAVYLLNDFTEDFPSYKELIEHTKLSRTIDLLSFLSVLSNPPAYIVWLEYMMLFCIDLKQEIKSVRAQSPALFEFFLSFIDQHINDIAPGLKTNIEEFLGEIRE